MSNRKVIMIMPILFVLSILNLILMIVASTTHNGIAIFSSTLFAILHIIFVKLVSKYAFANKENSKTSEED